MFYMQIKFNLIDLIFSNERQRRAKHTVAMREQRRRRHTSKEVSRGREESVEIQRIVRLIE